MALGAAAKNPGKKVANPAKPTVVTKPVTDGEAKGYSTTGGKKPNANQTMLLISSISVKEKFNPRTKPGKLEELTASIAKEGVISPITVRPTKKDGEYWVVAGERRYLAAKKAGHKEIPVVVRTDLDADEDALAVAIAENSEDGRTNLNVVDQGRAFKKLITKGWSMPRISAQTGTHSSRITRCLQVLEAPPAVIARVEEEKMGLMAAVEFSKADKNIQNKIKDSLTEDTSVNELKAIIKKASQEIVAPTPGGSARGRSGAAAGANLVIHKGARAKEDALVNLSINYTSMCKEGAEDSGIAHAIRGALTYGFWESSQLDSFIPYNDDAPQKVVVNFKRLVSAKAARYRGGSDPLDAMDRAGDGKKDEDAEEVLES